MAATRELEELRFYAVKSVKNQEKGLVVRKNTAKSFVVWGIVRNFATKIRLVGRQEGLRSPPKTRFALHQKRGINQNQESYDEEL